MLTSLECPLCGNKLYKYDHDESIDLECELLDCDYEKHIELEDLIAEN
ncbi:hypothetical protein [Bacillus wiedmannii]|nr:hypothetical protein [Bacillus wiedmannii]